MRTTQWLVLDGWCLSTDLTVTQRTWLVFTFIQTWHDADPPASVRCGGRGLAVSSASRCSSAVARAWPVVAGHPRLRRSWMGRPCRQARPGRLQRPAHSPGPSLGASGDACHVSHLQWTAMWQQSGTQLTAEPMCLLVITNTSDNSDTGDT